MTGLFTVLVALAMAVGIVGTIVPFLPGLSLVLGAGVVYGFVVGWDTAGFVAIAVMVLLLAAGSVAKYVLADRSALRGGAPRQSLILAAIGAVVGFFVIPVVGLVLGGVGALVVAEYQRTGGWETAWRSTRVTLLGVGMGVLLEAVAGVLMALTWGIWVLVE